MTIYKYIYLVTMQGKRIFYDRGQKEILELSWNAREKERMLTHA